MSTVSRRVGAEWRLWVSAAVLLVFSAVIWGLWVAPIGPLPPSPGHVYLHWWVMAVLFFAAERWPVVVYTRNGSFSVSLIEVPLLVGLFFSSPAEIGIGFAAGLVVAALTGLSARAGKTVFNFAQSSLFMGVAVIVFHAFAPTRPTDVDDWLAAYAATACVNLTFVTTLLAMRVFGDRLRFSTIWQTGALAVAGAVINGGFALVVSVLLWDDPKRLLLTVLPVGALIFLYHSYATERRRRAGVEFLRGTGDVFRTTPELEAALVAVLHSARDAFRATFAQLTVFPTLHTEHAFRTTIRADEPDEVMQPVSLIELDELIDVDGDGTIIHPTRGPEGSAQMLQNRGLQSAMVAQLHGRDRILGALVIGGHSAAYVEGFDESDLALFRNLAVQTAATLEKNHVEHTVASLTDLREKLTHQSFHDALTGLPNRALFSERIERGMERSQRSGNLAAVMLVNLDDFTGVNESLGHAVGDDVLVEAAQRIAGCLRQPDTASRWGGDEFGILLEELENVQEAEIVARRVLAVLKNPINIGVHTIRLRASIGIAVTSRDEAAGDVLLRYADIAMNTAKGQGKDCSVVYAKGMEAATVTRHEVRGALEHALDQQQFTVHYQPLVDLRDGRVIGNEALLRWWHPERGLIGPGEFIAIAEDSGLIVAIGSWVLREACAQTLRWQKQYPVAANLYVSVNVSTRQLQQPLFVEEVMATLADVGFNPAHLVLELTESMLLDHRGPLLAKLEALRRHGIRIAIDDFGTGYSSLSYLRSLPVDILKIAKPFVDDLLGDANLGNVARAIVALGHSLQMSLVAEGIEERVQLTRLRDMGCEYGQGYLLSHPVGQGQIDTLLESGAVIHDRPRDEGDDAHVIPLRR